MHDDHLLYPVVPAEGELLLAHAAVPRRVEDHEHVRDLLQVNPDHQIILTSYQESSIRNHL